MIGKDRISKTPSINSTLLAQINPFLIDYALDRNEIEKFLFPVIKRRSNVKEGLNIISKIMEPHDKKEIEDYLSELAKIEPSYSVIKKSHRDHVIHSLHTYILGIYLNELFLSRINVNVKKFEWKLAALFHDIGYPVEMGQYILNAHANEGNRIKKKFNIRASEFSFKVIPNGLLEISQNEDAISLLQKCVNTWELDIDVSVRYKKMINDGKISHGTVGALTMLNLIDVLYESQMGSRNSGFWDRSFFYNNIVPACSAIFIHDLPKKCFEFKKIDPKKAPLAFLLRLSDNLQEWQRPKGSYRGISPTKFDITISKNSLIFYAGIKKERLEKIKCEIKCCLNVKDVQLVGKTLVMDLK